MDETKELRAAVRLAIATLDRAMLVVHRKCSAGGGPGWGGAKKNNFIQVLVELDNAKKQARKAHPSIRTKDTKELSKALRLTINALTLSIRFLQQSSPGYKGRAKWVSARDALDALNNALGEAKQALCKKGEVYVPMTTQQKFQKWMECWEKR